MLVSEVSGGEVSRFMEAVRDTLVDHGERINKLEVGFARHEERNEHIVKRLNEIWAGVKWVIGIVLSWAILNILNSMVIKG